MHKSLVIDKQAANILDSALIEKSWFIDFNIPLGENNLRRVEVNGNIYLLSRSANEDSELLIIKVGKDGLFNEIENPSITLERIIRVSLKNFDRNISIPLQWQPYHQGSLISIYAQHTLSRNPKRICINQAPDDSKRVYAYALTDEPENLDRVFYDENIYNNAIENYASALISNDSPMADVGNFGILLSEPLGVKFFGANTFSEWYEDKLNKEQRKFVDKSTDHPIRLRGAAGTGKTQAMAVKCLKELYEGEEKGIRIAFLTHSSALAHDIVKGMLFSLDPEEKWNNEKTEIGNSRLWIGTLYELAQEQLGYEKKGLRPLSLDGQEGREYQKMIINDAINKCIKDARIKLDILSRCEDFSKKLESNQHRDSIIEELMNEFACTLDAENIKKGSSAGEAYIKTHKRDNWQMNLPTENHRKIALEIHEEYRNILKKEKFLSMDQMIADFGRYLASHEWEQLRDRDGFDLVFVDEYHYLTRVEAMTLHNLFKTRAERNGKWPLVMAYDLKQSTKDTPFGGGIEKFKNPGVGESIPVELTQLYRSTKQIAAVLHDIDACFPAMDLEGEFETYKGESKQHDGDIPLILDYETNEDLIDDVLNRANACLKGNSGEGKVAVLCLNENLFDIYRKAGRTQGKFIPITSREDLREIRHSKKKCIFSMPEYVAGLQFETVFMINIDSRDYDDDDYITPGAKRRYISRAYLGASRAQNKLVFASSKTNGGMSSILSVSLQNGNIIKP